MERIFLVRGRGRLQHFILLALVLFFALSFLVPANLHAIQRHLSFEQVVQQAELIFLGAVADQQCRYGPNQKMIFTDVHFDIEAVVHKRDIAQLVSETKVTLTFAGGQLEGEVVRILDVPSFETGARYLIFTRMDDRIYASPIIGAFQGLFRIIRDEVGGTDYPVTYEGRCLRRMVEGTLVTGPPLARIRNGTIEIKTVRSPIRVHEVAPEVVQGIGARVSSVMRMREQTPETIMTLDDLLHEIVSVIRQQGRKEGRR